MTDVHIEGNIIIADYAVVPGTLIHRILIDKMLILEGKSEPLVSTTLLHPSVHLSNNCDLSPGSRSVAILNCYSFVCFVCFLWRRGLNAGHGLLIFEVS